MSKLSILVIVETRTDGVRSEKLRLRVPPDPLKMLALVERAMKEHLFSDPDEILIRLLRPTHED